MQKNTSILKITLLLVSSMTVMAGAIIAPALPKIKAHFEFMPQAELLTQLVLTMPGIFIAMGAPLVGWIVDRYGRKRLLLASLLLYVISGTAGFYLNDLYWILASRAVLGLAVAGIMTITNTLVADYFEDRERSNFISLRGSFVALGGVVFVSTAGFLSEWSWRIPFLVYFFALLMLPLAAIFLYEPPYGKAKGGNQVSEDLEYPKAWIRFVYLIAFLGMAFFYTVPVHIPFYLKEVIGVRDSLVGISIAAAMLAAAFAAGVYSRIKARSDFNGIYSLCFLLMGLGFIVIAWADTYTFVVFGLIINGLGMGLIGPNHALCLMESAPAVLRGRVLGTLTTFVFVGQFSAPFVSQLATYLTGSLGKSFLLLAVLLIIMSLGFASKTTFFQKKTLPA